MDTLSKVEKYKLNSPKSVACLYTNYKAVKKVSGVGGESPSQQLRKLQDTQEYTCSRGRKSSAVQTWRCRRKEFNKTLRNGKASHFHSVQSPLKYQFFGTRKKHTVLKCIWKQERHRIAKAIRSQESNAGAITISELKLYYKSIV